MQMKKILAVSLFILCLISCKDKQPQFTIKGKITDADSTMMYLGRRTLAEIEPVDSVKLDKEGNFELKVASPENPDLYILFLNGQVINLGVDSTETITVNAAKSTFATEYTVEGSEASSKIKDITLARYKLTYAIKDLVEKYSKKQLTADEYTSQVQNVTKEYKNLAESTIRSDYKSLASYYALFQRVGDYLIFDPYDKKDRSLFQATATQWNMYKKDDPKAKQLESFTLSVLAEVRNQDSQQKTLDVINATPASSASPDYYNITLRDKNNKQVALSSLRGKAVILDFTVYGAEYSPAHNIQLNNVYKKYSGKLEVYQVSFDTNDHTWLNAANNLPWICVQNDPSLAENLMLKFNIQAFPTTYLLDKEGQLVKRLLGGDNLDNEIQKII